MTVHTKNKKVGDKEIPALVNDKGDVIMWLDQPETLLVGRQGGFTKPLGTYKRAMKKPLKDSPANVIGRVTL